MTADSPPLAEPVATRMDRSSVSERYGAPNCWSFSIGRSPRGQFLMDISQKPLQRRWTSQSPKPRILQVCNCWAIIRQAAKKESAAHQEELFAENLHSRTVQGEKKEKREKIPEIRIFSLTKRFPGSDLLSHKVSLAVPSAQESLTTVFEMETGVSSPLWPPGKNFFSKWFYRIRKSTQI